MDVLRTALYTERRQLRELTLQSKARSDYDEAFLDAWMLEYAEPGQGSFDRGFVRVLERAGHVVGYYALNPYIPEVDLTHLYVDKGHRRQKVGTTLLRDACGQALALGGVSLVIVSDSKAVGFYEACGAEQQGCITYEDMPGYYSPLLRLPLSGESV
jgi:GNAT superfamily N-acetyltransferase